jgi:uncharacterized protein DUF4760
MGAWEQHDEARKSVDSFIKAPGGGYTKEFNDISAYLNIHELVAVGIRNKVFDREVCYNFWSDALVRHTERTRKLIEHDVSSEGGAAAYLELRTLSIKWKKRITKWQKKEKRKAARQKERTAAAGQSPAQPSPGTIGESPPQPIKPVEPPPADPVS